MLDAPASLRIRETPYGIAAQLRGEAPTARTAGILAFFVLVAIVWTQGLVAEAIVVLAPLGAWTIRAIVSLVAWGEVEIARDELRIIRRIGPWRVREERFGLTDIADARATHDGAFRSVELDIPSGSVRLLADALPMPDLMWLCGFLRARIALAVPIETHPTPSAIEALRGNSITGVLEANGTGRGASGSAAPTSPNGPVNRPAAAPLGDTGRCTSSVVE